MSNALENLAPDQRKHVRERVRGLLERSESFGKLAAPERVALANGLVNVVAYLADPRAGQKTGAQPTAKALAGPGGGSNQDFGKAARAGTAAYKELVGAIDFPKFVSSLIDGVFNSVVDASIRQMEAYGKLLEAVVKSVDQFASDNFTLNQGRDWLVNRFPTQLKLEVDGDQPRLAPTSEGEDSGLADIKQQLGLENDVDLSEPESEAELARRAQLEMAKLRQKQLATMVLLGINRIVVTDGLINAKVVIDVKTHDIDTSSQNASSYDDALKTRQTGSGGGWFTSDYDHSQERHRTIVTSGSNATSQSEADVKAKLTGEVKLSFKSETFPLEKLASQTQLESVNERAQP